MKFQNLNARPVPRRINDLKELDPGFRPRWVRVRRICFGVAVASVFLFPFEARVGFWLFVAMQIAAVFALFPHGSMAAVGLLLRHFPKLALYHAKLHSWLELDLDYNEGQQ